MISSNEEVDRSNFALISVGLHCSNSAYDCTVTELVIAPLLSQIIIYNVLKPCKCGADQK